MTAASSLSPPSSTLDQLFIAQPSYTAAGRRSAKRQANALPEGLARSEHVSNLFTCAIDVNKLSLIRTIAAALADSLRSSHTRHQGAHSSGLGGLGGGGSAKLTYKPKRYAFHAERPNWKSDIRWVSADDEHTFGLFQTLFDKLGIAAAFGPLFGKIVLFSGFLVIRQCTRKSHFHADFSETNGKAFTLMTPLEDMSDLGNCHLLTKVPKPTQDAGSGDGVDGGEGGGGGGYTTRGGEGDGGGGYTTRGGEGGGGGGYTTRGSGGTISRSHPDFHQGSPSESPNEAAPVEDDPEVHGTSEAPSGEDVLQYRYELGRGICFGDGFIHATETGDSPRPLAFLCFTFGAGSLTDDEWAGAEGYISQQGPIYQHPSGKLVQSRAFSAAGQGSQDLGTGASVAGQKPPNKSKG